MDKRGQGLPLNTLILTILVVIVLIVVAVFFLGGTSKLSQSIRNIFFGTTAGTDLSLAREICETRCVSAQDSNDVARTAFCSTPFELDLDNDGVVEVINNEPKQFYCSGGDIGVTCPGVTCPTR